MTNLHTKYEIWWYYCAEFGLEKTNTNIGEFSSIKSGAWGKNEKLIIISYCHILNNLAEKFVLALAEVTFTSHTTVRIYIIGFTIQ